MEKFKWRKQDYFWVIGILIGIVIAVSSVRLSDNADITNIISLIAGSVSIALAVIAIWWGNVNNSETGKVYEKIGQKLDGVKGDTSVANQKIDELLQNIYIVIDTLPDISEDIKNSLKYKVDDAASKTKSGWKKDEKGWYFNGEEGNQIKEDWKKDGNRWFYLTKSGYIATDELIPKGDSYYYVDESGASVSGRFSATKRGLMYFDTDGLAVMDGEKIINGKTYTFKNGICEE